jgi:hypothetical protein
MSSSDGFVPQAESMDLRNLYDHQYVVAVSTGDRDDGKMLAKTMHGPYSFEEMISEVGRMWSDSQNNAKVYILEKDHRIKPRWLDAKTIDYIQAKYIDIIMDKILFSKEESFTCEAGIVSE